MKLLTVVLASGLGFFGVAGPAPAADLGGSCCDDLESRVATLEATTVNKGNRKIRLTITGAIDESVIWGTTNTSGAASRTYIMQNPNDQSEIDINADGKFAGDWHVGSSLELMINQPPPGSKATGTISTQQTYVYISNSFAKISLGTINEASKGLEEEGAVNLTAVAPELDISTLAAWGSHGGFVGSNLGELFGGNTGEGIGVTLTPMTGLTLSGTYTPETTATNAIKDVAARFSTVIGKDIMVTAGVGYHIDDMTTDKVLKANAGIEELTSGLFVQGAFGRDQLKAMDGWQVQAGLDKNLFSVGKTDIYGEFGELTGVSGLSPQLYGAGVQQAIDAGAAMLYAGYRHYSASAGGASADTVQAGLRIKF